MIKKKDITIGYCTAGDIKGLPEEFIHKINKEGSETLRDLNYEIVEFPEILSDYETASRLIDVLTKNKVKILIINVAAWFEAGITLRLIRELKNTTFIFWAFGNYNQTLTLTGLIESTSTLVKTGYKNFFTVIGSPESKEIKRELSSTLEASKIYRLLEYLNIGMIGSNCPGMIDSTFDEISLRKKIGCNLRHFDLSELIKIYDNISDSGITEEIKSLKSNIKKISVTENDLVPNILLYRALKKMINRHELDAFAIRCWPELKSNLFDYNATPCFALSKLADEGIIGACEADISSAITMLVLRYFTDTPPVNLDYNTVNTETNSITLWHCGANAMSLAKSCSSITFSRPTNGGLMELDCGMSVEFTLREGTVTLAKITRNFDKMLISTGKIINPNKVYRGGICEVVLDTDVSEYFSNIIREGIEHHICVVYGDIKRELIKMGNILMIDNIVLL